MEKTQAEAGASKETPPPYSVRLPTYLRVVQFSEYSNRGLELTVMGDQLYAELINSDPKSFAVNDRFSYNMVTQTSGSAVLLNSLVIDACREKVDWRTMGLRACILESLREKAVTQPSRVEWAIAEKMVPAKVSISKIPDTMKAAFLSARYVDSCIRSRGLIRVGAGANATWRLNDDQVAVVALDTTGMNSELLWCMWTLVHLGFPIVDVYEIFGIRSVSTTTKQTIPT
jgi:hypothetical protein